MSNEGPSVLSLMAATRRDFAVLSLLSSVAEYKYAPELADLRDVAEELYAEVGLISMTLVTSKVNRVRSRLS